MAPFIRDGTRCVYDYGHLIMSIAWTEAAIALVLLAGRFYTSWRITRRLKADFYIAFFTFCVAFIAQICLTISVQHGLGRHIGMLDERQKLKSMEYAWISQLMFVACMALGKLAIIAFLLQIRGPHDPEPWLLYFVGVTQAIVAAITIIFIIIQCSPVEKLWDRQVPGTCTGFERNRNFAFFQGSWSALGDLILALYPIHIIWKVKVSFHIKIGLCVLMGLGVIAAVCSAIRTSELGSLSHTDDVTFFLSPLIIWTATEIWIILIVGCVPPIRPLFALLFNNMSTITGASSRNKSYNRSHFSRVGEAVPDESSNYHYYLKPVAGPSTALAGSEADQHRYGTRSSAIREDGQHSGSGWMEAKGQDVVVTTRVDVDYDTRSTRTSLREEGVK